MANPTLVFEYKPKIWKTYEVTMGSAEMPELQSEHLLNACLSTSEFAEKSGLSPDAFVWDLECASAGIEADEKGKFPGGDLFRLVSDWQSHKKGDLVMFVFDEKALLSSTATIAVTEE